MKKLKQLPRYKSDADAERFVDEADLSEYDLSGFRPLSEVAAERRVGRPTLGDKKRQHVSLRLDPEVIAKFKATGKGWQSRINAVLLRSDIRLVASANPTGKAAAKRDVKAAAMPAPKAITKPAKRKPKA
jgi:uncharacterized protein (DUF4415 family)